MSDLGLETDSAMAEILIDSYLKMKKTAPGASKSPNRKEPLPSTSGASKMATSTPIRASHPRLMALQASEISSVESDTSERTMTGVESLPDTDQSDKGTSSRMPKLMPVLRSGRTSTQKQLSGSFIDSFELSIDVSQQRDEDEMPEDNVSDYELDMSFTAVFYLEKKKTAPGASKSPNRKEPLPSTSGASKVATSTPIRASHPRLMALQASEISPVESDTSERTMTRVERLPDTDQSDKGTSRMPKVMPVLRSGRTSTQKQLSGSFIDSFELSIDVSQQRDEDEMPEDNVSDYELDMSFTAVLPDEINNAASTTTLEEIQFGVEPEDDHTTEQPDDGVEEETAGIGVAKVQTVEECQAMTEEIMCLVYFKQILQLAATPSTRQCQQCSSPVRIDHMFKGSALYLTWTCAKEHIQHRWCSQPVLNRRLHSGDFLSALAITYSGNNFGKVAMMADLLNLKFMSSSTFYRIQATYLVPTVDNFWEELQADFLSSVRDRELIILGYCRMDSPGHSAQYCSYTVMDNDTKKILMLKTLDKRSVDRKSANMEKKGFEICMTELQDKGLTVKEVVTDAHLGIGAYMRTQHPNIKHSNDVWHAAKNLGKKILMVG